ncbi:MAG: alpha-xylosidase, partial [Chryseobacterium sp.]
KSIAIENQNSWTDGGVASPTPFYWSTKGYGVLFYTFKKGRYDFESSQKGAVTLAHETDYLDVFFMVNDGVVPILNDFYQLTGNPVLLPKFGFYEGHLNAFNRDYWKADTTGILFEDGIKYKESQKDNGGIKESLNGEKDNYQFSARGVIDRYKKHDMPLGWILPNDGYGAGYGQTETLDGNIANLKSFGDYARKNGVEIGLWTQSDLHPKSTVSALLQRDILKEVKEAGVRVLKTDVAWVGAGYSFGLNGVADVGQIMPQYGNNARPFIISLDGWAGTQRYATIWSGDQTGGNWEYIRFHIPTYIGSGLSGQPNITSDMDGIFGGKNTAVNIRDFQWKTFTPMQLNMDGWGSSQKYPHAQGEPVASINRNYLKLKSALLPYQYSIAKEAVNGLPIIRAMFLASPNAYTQGVASQYQYLFGPSFLVAPIYQATKADEKGNDIRNNIYLPEGKWIDYFSGEVY